MSPPTAGHRRREPGPADRTADQRLATIHLRTGSLTLARAELESMAGDGLLDDDALVDLAEVRWRTGDLSGAGEAAEAYLETGRESTMVLVIAAEAQAALGRPGEARRLADRALHEPDRPLDAIFAGLPRASFWPRDPGLEAAIRHAEAAREVPHSPMAERRAAAAARRAGDTTGADAGRAATTGTTAAHAESVPSAPHGVEALRAAEAALAAGDEPAAAIQLGLVLRISPGLAPAVLDLVRDRPGASFDLVRGDAYRLVGHESEARRAFASAAGGSAGPAAGGSASPDPASPDPASPGQLSSVTDATADPAVAPQEEP